MAPLPYPRAAVPACFAAERGASVSPVGGSNVKIDLMESNTLKAYRQAAATYDAEPNSVLFTETETVLAMQFNKRA